MKQNDDDGQMLGVFPCPVYMIKRAKIILPTEEMEIENLIRAGMHVNVGNSSTDNSYIFDTKLQELKQFCNKHVKEYVEQVICPKEDLDFYITQSWLNITKPGGFHHQHFHSNSIVSGVFYISTFEDDKISFNDPNGNVKTFLKLEPKEWNNWNSSLWHLPVANNDLLLFPSWLNHSVILLEKVECQREARAGADRISISFNTFVRGKLGAEGLLTELIL